MRRAYLVIIALVILGVLAFTIIGLWEESRAKLSRRGGSALEVKFRELMRRDEEFRRAVSELRSMLLDPSKPFDEDRAMVLFNEVLSKLELGPLPEGIRYGKGRLLEFAVGEKPRCAKVRLWEFMRIHQPRVDVEAGNGLEAIYLCARPSGREYLVEVTLVFSDEDKPGEDLYYDAWRLVSWGRARDIETFFVVLDPSARLVKRVVFEGLYLSLRNCARPIAPIYGLAGFSRSSHRSWSEHVNVETIDVYVNTWNHALALEDANPHLKHVTYTFSNTTVVVGSRLDAELNYSDIPYTSEALVVRGG